MIGDLVSIGIALIFVPLAIFGWLIVAHNLRVWRTQRLYRSLPTDLRRRFLDQIDAAGRDARACSLLVAEEVASESGAKDVTASWYGGGQPYAEAGDSWPTLEKGGDTPADFLIQVRLDASFPPPWVGRLIVVFNKFNPNQTVRVYENPSVVRYAALSGGPTSQKEWSLRSVSIPRPRRSSDGSTPDAEDADGEAEHLGGLLNYDPVVLFDAIPGLRDELTPLTRRPADLLGILIAPNHCGYEFAISDIVQVGGRPVWLQEDLGSPNCEQCGRPMRFLFQFGDLNGGVTLGDAGVCYVFGCDEHPNAAVGTVQMC